MLLARHIFSEDDSTASMKICFQTIHNASIGGGHQSLEASTRDSSLLDCFTIDTDEHQRLSDSHHSILCRAHSAARGSSQDMLAVIHSSGSLKVLCKRQLKHYDREAKLFSQWATVGRLRQACGHQRSGWATGRRLTEGFITHREVPL